MASHVIPQCALLMFLSSWSDYVANTFFFLLTLIIHFSIYTDLSHVSLSSAQVEARLGCHRRSSVVLSRFGAGSLRFVCHLCLRMTLLLNVYEINFSSTLHLRYNRFDVSSNGISCIWSDIVLSKDLRASA